MRASYVVVDGVRVTVFVTEIEMLGGMLVSLTDDPKHEYDTVAFGKTEEEAKEKLVRLLV